MHYGQILLREDGEKQTEEKTNQDDEISSGLVI